MKLIELDMIQTAGIGSLALLVGMTLTRKVSFLQKFCIPSPVSGGIIFSLLTLALYTWFHIEVSFDKTLMDVFMLAFFTCVGFQSDLKVLKQGGKLLVIMISLLIVMIAMQNLMPMGITRLMDVDPLVGMATGSISMTGGHGTAGGNGTEWRRNNRNGSRNLWTDCRLHAWWSAGREDNPHKTDRRTNAAKRRIH